MKIILQIILINAIMFGAHQLLGQGPRHQKIRSAKIAMITEHVQLTPEQAEKFWPLYREYENKVNALRKGRIDGLSNVNFNTITDEQAKEIMKDNLETRQKEIDIQQMYFADKFYAVLSPRQVLQLAHVERKFHKMLLKRLDEHHQKRDH